MTNRICNGTVIGATICIIPARGGSKRIPGKNIKSFCGHPIIQYPLCAAEASNCFDKIVISSDINAVLTMYSQYAQARGKKTSTDTATLADVTLEVLSKNKGHEFACVILPTAVFVTAQTIRLSRKFLDNMDAVMSVNAYRHPVERAMHMKDYALELIKREYQFYRTQDLPVSYHDAGQLYWINVKSFLKHKTFFMPKCAGYLIESVDIDDESDWRRAEEAYRARNILDQ